MRSGKQIDYTKEEVLEAIKGSFGIISKVAENLNCSWATARKYINQWECTKDALEEENEVSLDFSESKLFKRIDEGSDAMIKFHLMTKGRKRGYISQQDINLGDLDLKVVIE